MSNKIYTGTAAKEIDRLAIDEYGYEGLVLMTRAGEVSFKRIHASLQSDGVDRRGRQIHILVLCGGGNNGGDGYVVARCALESGWQVTLITCGEPSTADAKTVAEIFRKAGGVVTDLDTIDDTLRVDVVVDALLGVGLAGKPRPPYAAAIKFANKLSAFKVAIDVPSGVDADTGQVYADAFVADFTIGFIARKLGLLTGPAKNFVGRVVTKNLDIKQNVMARVAHCATVLRRPIIPQRQPDSHKGTYGNVLIAGGDDGMLGAVLLAGKAALRCGAGKVHIMSSQANLDRPALFCPELMSVSFESPHSTHLNNANALVLGPGLGLGVWGSQVFRQMIVQLKPMVIDAGGLTFLSTADVKGANPNWVLTPHPGEAARLLDCSTVEIQNDRLSAVRNIASKFGCVCVLKGAGTLIADASGRVSLCDLGNAGMATAGTGDVLSGMIAAYFAQGMNPRAAAEAGVWLHSHAADLVVIERSSASLIASDIIDALPIATKN